VDSTRISDRPWTGESESRGQTTLDFAIGISLFIAVLIFIFIFVPGILDPFTTGTQEEAASSNWIADELSQHLLGSPQRPYILDRQCTVDFFAGNNPTTNSCQYHDGPPQNLTTHLGIGPHQSVNVSIQSNVTGDQGFERLCWDDSTHTLFENDGDGRSGGVCDPTAGDVRLSRGPVPPQGNRAAVSARRVVSLAHEDVTLVVVVWE
jgi:hypothetical protein